MDKIISEILNIPNTLYIDKDLSIYKVLERSNYFLFFSKIGQKEIRNVLMISESNEIVRDWLRYSEDKRTSCGWYFISSSEDVYEVGRVDNKGKKESQLYFSDVTDACAFFIKNEIEEIRLANHIDT